MEQKKTMRHHWFDFVAKIRRKLTRKEKKPVSHRDAMKEASKLWPKEKLKVLNKIRREERKAAKALNSTPKEAADESAQS